ncbi:RHS repeat-associated core domain-containing protein, partial [Pantoea sp. B65]|uniref:RHS repeat-associated core domain-containing protein n=1 Tax=Pantoea sp. B65 TaxID=2813359 RepID=UPI0039B3E16D
YQAATLPGRLLSITENGRITERFIWAGNTPAEKQLNLAGQNIRHYDCAGLEQINSIALSGSPLSVTRQLLPDNNQADWQGNDESAWKDLLAAETFTSLSGSDASGATLTRTDARGNTQRLAYDMAGQLTASWLTLKGAAEQLIVKSIRYSAAGQKLREEHGNGVVTTYHYEAQTRRLTGITTQRPAGHPAGAKILQDLRYQYDPVGNVLHITNDAETTQFWRNQKVVPENTYTYDTLYQLVSATGRELAATAQQRITLPSPVVPLAADDKSFTVWTRSYRYDRGGNLTQIRHAASGNNHTTNITVSDRSNRAVLSSLTEDPQQVDALFNPGGQQLQLQPGQNLSWTARGELLKVTPVTREGQASDAESYRYAADSQRLLKISVQKTGNSTQTQRVLYLPGLELRSSGQESLQAIAIGAAGRAMVRVLHWESGKPADISNNPLRYSYDNLPGSSELELDGDGKLISQEEYYPYGGTAVWTARSQTEANYKTIRYSGKERDATGLYYYGYRYYQPWLGRWLSADPAGTVDGLNLYDMVLNNPMTLSDSQGMAGRQGYIYSPFTSFDMIRQAMGLNMPRYLSGRKNLYPLIVPNDKALEDFMEMRIMQITQYEDTIAYHKSELNKVTEELSTLYLNPLALTESQPSLSDSGGEQIEIKSQLEATGKILESKIHFYQTKKYIYSEMKYISATSVEGLKSLRPESDKLYIIGHGAYGANKLTSEHSENKVRITSEELVNQLATGGLTKEFIDIRLGSCWSGDATKPSFFEIADPHTASGASGQPLAQPGTKRPFAKYVSEALKREGYSQTVVSGYSGKGIVPGRTSYNNIHHVRRTEGVPDVRRSMVRRFF